MFRAYRDRLRSDVARASRTGGRTWTTCSARCSAGVDVRRRDLTLAWDFTVASGDNLSERLLAMRDDAFAALGDAAPAFAVTGVAPSTRANLATEVQGTFQVPQLPDRRPVRRARC